MKKIWRILWKATLWFFIVTIVWVLLLRWINPPTTFLQLAEWVRCDTDRFSAGPWVDYDDLPHDLVMAAIASEDQNFLKHSGFDLGAIEKAMKHNETSKRKRGASTISQQTAKNVFLWQGRNWVRKGFEVYFTFLVELLWSKERILEVYLNVIEMGEFTFGAESASQRYFNHGASKLTKSECALIIAALPSPKKSNPGKPSAFLIKRRDHILQQMRYMTGYFERNGH